MRRSARGKRGKDCPWEALPEGKERWLPLGLQVSGLKLLRTDEKWGLQAWEGWLWFKQRLVRGKAQCAIARGSVEMITWSPRGSLGWRSVGVSRHWCIFGYSPIQATSPEITKRKGTATVEWEGNTTSCFLFLAPILPEEKSKRKKHLEGWYKRQSGPYPCRLQNALVEPKS